MALALANMGRSMIPIPTRKSSLNHTLTYYTYPPKHITAINTPEQNPVTISQSSTPETPTTPPHHHLHTIPESESYPSDNDDNDNTPLHTETTPTSPTPVHDWIFYDTSTPKHLLPSIGDTAYGYCDLPGGQIFSAAGTVLEMSTLPRAVVVIPETDAHRESHHPTSRPDMVTTARRDGPPPVLGEIGEGFYEPPHEDGVISFGPGRVVAVFEDARIYLVAGSSGGRGTGVGVC
ncbi:hypothetical protein BJX61DRAFT_542756 [Aspergillus egyptiacus]|nr:hypothetical protein BJX61DRAFT_542756 [Aspergillus egyptiacus]